MFEAKKIEATPKIRIFPENFTHSFTIYSTNSGSVLISELFNDTGKVIQRDILKEKMNIFILRDYPSGLYLCRILDEYGNLIKVQYLVKK